MNINYLIENIIHETIDKYLNECRRNDTPMQKYSNLILKEVKREFDIIDKNIGFKNVFISSLAGSVYITWLDSTKKGKIKEIEYDMRGKKHTVINTKPLAHQLRISDHYGDNNKVKSVEDKPGFLKIENTEPFEYWVWEKGKKHRTYVESFPSGNTYVYDIRNSKLKKIAGISMRTYEDMFTSEYQLNDDIDLPIQTVDEIMYNALRMIYVLTNENDLNNKSGIDDYFDYKFGIDIIDAIDTPFNKTEYFNSNKHEEEKNSEITYFQNKNQIRNEFYELIFKKCELNNLYSDALSFFYFLVYKLNIQNEQPAEKDISFISLCMKYLHIYITPNYVHKYFKNLLCRFDNLLKSINSNHLNKKLIMELRNFAIKLTTKLSSFPTEEIADIDSERYFQFIVPSDKREWDLEKADPTNEEYWLENHATVLQRLRDVFGDLYPNEIEERNFNNFFERDFPSILDNQLEIDPNFKNQITQIKFNKGDKNELEKLLDVGGSYALINGKIEKVKKNIANNNNINNNKKQKINKANIKKLINNKAKIKNQNTNDENNEEKSIDLDNIQNVDEFNKAVENSDKESNNDNKH